MRRLAIVTDAVAPWHSGGKETRTWHYAQELARTGFEVHIYTMKWWPGDRVRTQGPVQLHALCRLWPLYKNHRRSVLQAIAFSLACVRLLTARFDLVEVDQIPILPRHRPARHLRLARNHPRRGSRLRRKAPASQGGRRSDRCRG
jgi:hypothetical protein